MKRYTDDCTMNILKYRDEILEVNKTSYEIIDEIVSIENDIQSCRDRIKKTKQIRIHMINGNINFSKNMKIRNEAKEVEEKLRSIRKIKDSISLSFGFNTSRDEIAIQSDYCYLFINHDIILSIISCIFEERPIHHNEIITKYKYNRKDKKSIKSIQALLITCKYMYEIINETYFKNNINELTTNVNTKNCFECNKRYSLCRLCHDDDKKLCNKSCSKYKPERDIVLCRICNTIQCRDCYDKERDLCGEGQDTECRCRENYQIEHLFLQICPKCSNSICLECEEKYDVFYEDYFDDESGYCRECYVTNLHDNISYYEDNPNQDAKLCKLCSITYSDWRECGICLSIPIKRKRKRIKQTKI